MPETAALPTAQPVPAETFSAALPDGTLLAFDFGEKRIGVAVGESALGQAHPLTTIRSTAKAERFAAIAALIAEWRPAGLVVGLPLTLDGEAHAMTTRCRRFANQLRGRFGLPVAYAEERFSSIEAQERLHAGGHDTRSARVHLDAVAAQVILQNHFAAQTLRNAPGAQEAPGGADTLSGAPPPASNP